MSESLSSMFSVRYAWQIFLRDIARLGRTKKSWIILIGLVITPALYSWVNIAAFWDPYGATENIKVAVVNEDKGGSSDVTGHIDVGKQVTEQLHDNHQLGWQFLDAEEAERSLERGETFATVTIPENFSSDLLGALHGQYAQPTLEYRVNEKASAIAPKITDSAASSLDEQITSAFKQQVAEAAASSVRDEGNKFEDRLQRSRQSSEGAFDKAANNIESARADLREVGDKLGNSQVKMQNAKQTVRDVEQAMTDAQAALGDVQDVIASAQGDVTGYTDSLTSAFVEGSTGVAQGTARAQESVADITAQLDQANSRFNSATQQTNDAIAAGDESIRQLRDVVNSPAVAPGVAGPLNDAIATLEEGNAANKQLLGNLQALSNDSNETAKSVKSTADAVNQAAQDTKKTSQVLSDTVDKSVPEINRAMSNLSSKVGAFSASLDTQKATMEETQNLLDGVGKQLGATQDALGSFDSDLASLEDGVEGARDDVRAITAHSRTKELQTITGLNSDEIGSFFADPVEVKSAPVYPVGSYGSAMASLFTNLSLWIGAFVLVVIFRVEVDLEGFKRLTVGQAYLGRFLLMAVMAMVQAVIVTVGDLAVGVQTVNPVAFVATGTLIALAYLSIIYALSTALGHVGRGLAVVLVIVQIPGASGLYPIELMPNFFRSIYPLLPFSYGIDAMRETIGGFYGLHYLKFMSVLALMFVVAFALGLLGRRSFAHFNLLFNRELAKTDLIAAENVQIVGDGYRFADVLKALQGREEFAADLEKRKHDYRHWIRVAAVLGVVGMVVLGIVAALVPSQKPLLLGIWTLWCLLILGIVVTLEYLRKSLAQSTELVDFNEEELRHSVAARGEGVHSASAEEAQYQDGVLHNEGTLDEKGEEK